MPRRMSEALAHALGDMNANERTRAAIALRNAMRIDSKFDTLLDALAIECDITNALELADLAEFERQLREARLHDIETMFGGTIPPLPPPPHVGESS